MTVAENIVLGDRAPSKTASSWPSRAAEVMRVRELSDQVRLVEIWTALVADITVGQQQRVEILKALYRWRRATFSSSTSRLAAHAAGGP